MLFKKIEGFNNYWINFNGEIFSDNLNDFLKTRLSNNGYLFVNLYQNGKQYTKKIHRLVAETFIENQNNYDTVDHLDRNKLNNNIENLRWTTIQRKSK